MRRPFKFRSRWLGPGRGLNQIPMESVQDKLFSKLPRHQNEMMTEYGLAAPVVSADILVGLRYIYNPYVTLNQFVALAQRTPGWGLSNSS